MAQLPQGNSDVESIRNITVLGHVDHGKTTFVDSLLAANNIISKRSAGKIRYMDSREDEQERGITMESSAVSLYFTLQSKTAVHPAGTYTLNLIDTPGHVDFSSEVSTASQLCDGAIVMLDAVEGVCTQTISVLRQTWADRIRPVLVINKMDRLITELKLEPLEAYHHLARLVEQVNSIIGSFYQSERMENDYNTQAPSSNKPLDTDEVAAKLQEADTNVAEEEDDEDLYFSPERNNVIFASAIDGWAFRTKDFARIFATKFGFNSSVLGRLLWGDFYWDTKTKRVIGPKQLRGRNLKPMFVQIALDNLWAVYRNVVMVPDTAKTHSIVKTLNLNIPDRQLESKDQRQVLSTILSQWLPLVSTTVQAVIEMVPSPRQAQRERFDAAILRGSGLTLANLENKKLAADIMTCSSTDDSYVTGYISKMFAVSRAHLPLRRPGASKEQSDDAQIEDDEILLAFARLYSGTLCAGTQVTVVLPKYDNTIPSSDPRNAGQIISAEVGSLYLMMGRELRPCSEIKAGNIFAASGLEEIVFRSATIYSHKSFESSGVANSSEETPSVGLLNLCGRSVQVRPFVRYAVEPTDSADLAKLAIGLKRLSRADPCVETYQEPTGEHVIVTAGELHFERCLKDLKERFAKIDIQVSKPIVPFRETIAVGSSEDSLRKTLDCGLSIQLSIKLLPSSIRVVVEQHSRNLEDTNASKSSVYWHKLNEAVIKSTGSSSNYLLWATGPGRNGSNILVDARDQKLNVESLSASSGLDQEEFPWLSDHFLNDLDMALKAGFQQAVEQGPLCGEPLSGMMFTIHTLGIDPDNWHEFHAVMQHGQFMHSCQSDLKDLIEELLLRLPMRLMLAMYDCEIQASADVLGKVYAVVSQCHGYVVSEDLREGTSYFAVQAKIPAIESFGFADEIRKKTSGSANPQLVFGGFEVLDVDPFWIPTTEEELEDWGEKADHENIAKVYLERVRERKGLFVGKKLVLSAEKQRTLKH